MYGFFKLYEIFSNINVIISGLVFFVGIGVLIYLFETGKIDVSKLMKNKLKENKLKDKLAQKELSLKQMNKLLRDVQKLKTKEINDADIIKKLVKMGWPRNEVKVALVELEMIKYNLKVSYKKLENLDLIVEKMIQYKIPNNVIERILTKKGWPKKIVDAIIKEQ